MEGNEEGRSGNVSLKSLEARTRRKYVRREKNLVGRPG